MSICRITREECINLYSNEKLGIKNHKDCFNCYVWNGVVVNGNDPEKYKIGGEK